MKGAVGKDLVDSYAKRSISSRDLLRTTSTPRALYSRMRCVLTELRDSSRLRVYSRPRRQPSFVPYRALRLSHRSFDSNAKF
jgi:hypothetical protein